MKGKKYSYAKDDKTSTHTFGVFSVLDNPSHNEKFEAFVAKAFMRAHTASIAKAINGMSKETLDVVKAITGKFDNFLQYSKNVEEQIEETVTSSTDFRTDTSDVFGLVRSNLKEKRIAALKEKKEETEEIGPDVAEESEESDSKTVNYVELYETDKDELIFKLINRIHELDSTINRLESSVHKMMDSGANQLRELPTIHADHVDRIMYKMNKEIKADSNTLFNMYITFKSKHYTDLTKDFKKENPEVSISGLKIRGAHKSYESADKHAREIAKIDDYMDTYVFEFGKWISLPIRTDAAESVVYREKELNELLSTRMDETEKIKQSRREGMDVTDRGL